MGLIRPSRKPPRARLQVEQLEDRLAPASLAPTAMDQLLLEQLNDARANPAAYGQSIGLSLSNVAPAQPLAWDPRLIAAAQGHSQDMNDHNYFDHVGSDGLDPGQRIAYQGYAYNGWGESIAAGYGSTASALQGLIIDAGVPSLGHRLHLLAMTSNFQSHTQIGIGIVMNGSGTYGNYYTLDTAAPLSNVHFLTGVVYNDANSNGKYDVGEGLGGVNVTVQGVGSTTSFGSGGYSIAVNPGTFTVTASGNGLTSTFTQTVTMGTVNKRLQIVQGGSNVQPPPNTPPVVSIAQHNADVAFVNQLYQTYLKRPPTSTELTYLTTQLDQGQTTFAAATSMVKASQEYRNVCTVWLRQVYTDMLGRNINSIELGRWVSYLQGPATMDTVANAVVNSLEHHILVWSGWVREAYYTYLHRNADSTEVGNWVGAFQSGWTKDNLVTVMVTSAEYRSRVGSSNSQFVAALYQDILGRTAGTNEISGWVIGLNAGVSRATVAAAFLASYEYRWRTSSLWAARLYSSCLGRPAGTAEINALANALIAGVSCDAITANVLMSHEYYLRAHG